MFDVHNNKRVLMWTTCARRVGLLVILLSVPIYNLSYFFLHIFMNMFFFFNFLSYFLSYVAHSISNKVSKIGSAVETIKNIIFQRFFKYLIVLPHTDRYSFLDTVIAHRSIHKLYNTTSLKFALIKCQTFLEH